MSLRWQCRAWTSIALSATFSSVCAASEGDVSLAPGLVTTTTAKPSAPRAAIRKFGAPKIVAMTPLSWRTGSVLPPISMTLPEPITAASVKSYEHRFVPSPHTNPYAPFARRFQFRGTGMIDAYAKGKSGLRVSVGGNNHMQYYAADYGPGAAAGSAAKMRLPRGAVSLRDGYEYYAPAAMAGYDVPVNDRLKVGVEGGMMKGRAASIFATDYLPGGAGESHYANNPVGDVMMTLQF